MKLLKRNIPEVLVVTGVLFFSVSFLFFATNKFAYLFFLLSGPVIVLLGVVLLFISSKSIKRKFLWLFSALVLAFTIQSFDKELIRYSRVIVYRLNKDNLNEISKILIKYKGQIVLKQNSVKVRPNVLAKPDSLKLITLSKSLGNMKVKKYKPMIEFYIPGKHGTNQTLYYKIDSLFDTKEYYLIEDNWYTQ